MVKHNKEKKDSQIAFKVSREEDFIISEASKEISLPLGAFCRTAAITQAKNILRNIPKMEEAE